MKIAVIGSGISGLSAAWLLYKQYEVTVFEKNDYLGGHTRTVEVDYDGVKIPVDTGFIVFNHRNYPNLTPLFKLLDVKTQESNMSFSASLFGGEFEYSCRNLIGFLGQPANALKPQFWRMIADIFRFNKQALQVLEADTSMTLGSLLDSLNMSRWFRERYILPMGAAIWSTPVEKMLDYPAKSFVQFFHNHGLLTVNDQPQWHTVTGGSREYVKKMIEPFKNRIHLNTPVTHIERKEKVTLKTGSQNLGEFDQVIIAAHGDQALQMIDASKEERAILSSFRYQPNVAYLHRDPALMPKRTSCWASWNYLSGKRGEVSLTYWMNLLQSIPESQPIFVTLNPETPPKAELTFDRYMFEHPLFDEPAIQAQSQIASIQGKNKLWFCGAYQKYGFHEDGLNSAINVATSLGASIPWR